MGDRPTFKRKKTTTASLNTPCIFQNACSTGPEPNSTEFRECYTTYCEKYAPSLKDIELLSSHGVKSGLTIIIRNPFSSFQPTLDHTVKIENKIYSIVDIQTDNNFIKVILDGDF